MQRRRLHDRFELRLPVTAKASDGPLEGHTVNVSLGGMMITLAVPTLPLGDAVELELELPALRERSLLPCTVRWCRGGSIGVQFGSLRAKEVWALNQLFRNAQKLSESEAETE